MDLLGVYLEGALVREEEAVRPLGRAGQLEREHHVRERRAIRQVGVLAVLAVLAVPPMAIVTMAIVTMAIVTKGITLAIVTMALAAQVLPRFKTRHCLAYLLLCAMTASLGL